MCFFSNVHLLFAILKENVADVRHGNPSEKLPSDVIDKIL